MCFLSYDPISILRWHLSFWSQLHCSLVTNAAMQVRNSLAQMHEQRPSDKWRSPLLSLHVSTLKPTPKPRDCGPRRDVYLVK